MDAESAAWTVVVHVDGSSSRTPCDTAEEALDVYGMAVEAARWDDAFEGVQILGWDGRRYQPTTVRGFRTTYALPLVAA
jgi:hypothetical protein